MVFLDWKALPWYWHGQRPASCGRPSSCSPRPALLAFVFGFFAFRSRIRGVYFSIITQALTFAFMLLFFRNETGFGGNNGFTDFKRILGIPITAPSTRVALFALSAAALLGALFLCRYVVTSKFGRVLDRDPRRRVARHVPRLQPALVQARRVDAVGGAVRHRRARSTSRRWASSIPAR